MRKLLSSILAITVAFASFAGKYEYRTVEGDPLKTLMYTLPNGLKVFMSVNKDEPRIQANIVVRVGGKNDPKETTGLAHYFEHMMFKGSEQFGTQDYAAEKPLLDQIEQLFEVYRQTTDSLERKAIYHRIDSISYQASLIAIPNEYDKLMSAIGAEGTNAYTSYDVTCYVENIPSNQIENWARIQADRFKHPVLRGFHTELETIYEEKNMSLTQDSRKVLEAMNTALFPSHPYGTQTVLGTQTHLKNPSITNIKKYHAQWYVPNNMAVVAAGDFDPDNFVDIIIKHFGDMKPNSTLPTLDFPAEAPITEPIKKEVWGNDAENIYLGWHLPAAKDDDMLVMEVLDRVLANGSTGLIDLNINHTQRLQSASAFVYAMADQGAYLMYGQPKAGQTLDEVRDILLAEIANLREGRFDEALIPAIAANLKLELQRSFEKNGSRVSFYTDAFVNGQDWADRVADFQKLDNITKADIVAAANKYLGPSSYAAIYKLQGPDPNELKISKPELTPIATNRDAASAFLTEIKNTKVEPIEPVFLDFDKDLTILTAENGIPVYYTKNETNDLFSITYIYDLGTNDDRRLSVTGSYLEFVGTPDMTAEDIKKAFYALACDYRVSVGQRRTYVNISGLSENMPQALALYEKLVAEGQPDRNAYDELIGRIEQSRINAKANQNVNFSRLMNYAMYGSGKNPSTAAYSPEELKAIDPQEFLNALRELNQYEQRVIYYGNLDSDKVISTINDTHKLPASLKEVPHNKPYDLARTNESTIFVAPYDAKQLRMCLISTRDEFYDLGKENLRAVYNEYFGGSMNSIVFQEMRESRSLAYSAYAVYYSPSFIDEPYFFYAGISTQNDKMMDAISAFNGIINDMPQSQSAFELAKAGIESRLRSGRIIKDDIAWTYINAQDLGISHDTRRDLFEALPGITLENVAEFQKANVAGRTFHYAILGDTSDIDLEALKKIGRVIILTPEDTFGY